VEVAAISFTPQEPKEVLFFFRVPRGIVGSHERLRMGLFIAALYFVGIAKRRFG